MLEHLTRIYPLFSPLFRKISHVTIVYVQHPFQITEGFIIHCLNLKYTTEMEKALLGAHGVCYEVYRRKLKVRIQVEQRRERDYLLSQQMVSDLSTKLQN